MEKTLKLSSNEEAIELYGPLDENIRYAEKEFHVRISARNHRLKITGTKKDVEDAIRFFNGRLSEIRRKPSDAPSEKQARRPSGQTAYRAARPGGITYFHRGRHIQPRSENQGNYMQLIDEKDIVICIGPAGTGKTYLAMASAIEHLKKKRVARIILTRPAVEAGESLGFLPGDLYAKVNPYLRPLYDALYDMMDYEEASRCLERGVIEVAPLAYMRGRTLNDSFVILDEAQNCTHAQMKMFLTRLGEFSKTVVTGDVTQIDLPGGKMSGLVEIQRILSGIKGIGFMYFKQGDVVRHPLVQEIIAAYDKFEQRG